MRRRFVFVLTMALAASAAYGQKADTGADGGALPAKVAVARCAYTSGDGCPSQNQDVPVLAQGPRRMPPYPPRPMGPPPGYGYHGFGMGDGHPGHALIGAVLLGGLGGSLAYNTHPNHQTQPNVVAGIFCGGLGAAVGWIIGYHIPWEHSPRFHRRSWPDEDEQATVREPSGGLSASH